MMFTKVIAIECFYYFYKGIYQHPHQWLNKNSSQNNDMAVT